MLPSRLAHCARVRSCVVLHDNMRSIGLSICAVRLRDDRGRRCVHALCMGGTRVSVDHVPHICGHYGPNGGQCDSLLIAFRTAEY